MFDRQIIGQIERGLQALWTEEDESMLAVLKAAVAVADAHRAVCEADFDKADDVCEAFYVRVDELAELIPPAGEAAP